MPRLLAPNMKMRSIVSGAMRSGDLEADLKFTFKAPVVNREGAPIKNIQLTPMIIEGGMDDFENRRMKIYSKILVLAPDWFWSNYEHLWTSDKSLPKIAHAHRLLDRLAGVSVESTGSINVRLRYENGELTSSLQTRVMVLKHDLVKRVVAAKSGLPLDPAPVLSVDVPNSAETETAEASLLALIMPPAKPCPVHEFEET